MQRIGVLERTEKENILVCHASVKPPLASPDTAVPFEINAISIGLDQGIIPAVVIELPQTACPPDRDAVVKTV
jgi:hypothetical protein